MDLNEVKERFIDAKADAAKAQWSQEMESLYIRQRDRVIIQILERPSLSSKNKVKVVEFLKATTLSSGGLVIPPTNSARRPGDPRSPLRRVVGASTPNPPRPALSKAQIGAPIASSFRKLTRDEAMTQMAAQAEAAKQTTAQDKS